MATALPKTPGMAGPMTPEEDSVLRRLHWFERFGAHLSPGLRGVKDGIRSRDKRSVIREPQDTTMNSPQAEKPVSST